MLERIRFVLLQENWGDFGEQFADWAAHLVDELRSGTGEAIRDGHNEGMAEAARSSDLEVAMRTFEWAVESGPPTGAILPDCFVVAFDEYLPTGTEAEQTDPGAGEGLAAWKSTTGLDYEVSLTGCGDESTSRAGPPTNWAGATCSSSTSSATCPLPRPAASCCSI